MHSGRTTYHRREYQRIMYLRSILMRWVVVTWLLPAVSGNAANFSVELDTAAGCDPNIAKISITPLTDVHVTTLIIYNNDGDAILSVDTSSLDDLKIREQCNKRITFKEIMPGNKGYLFAMTDVTCEDTGIYRVDIKHTPDDVAVHEISISRFKGIELKPRFYFGDDRIGHLSHIDVVNTSTVVMETGRGLQAYIELMIDDEKVSCHKAQSCTISLGNKLTDGVRKVLIYHVHYTEQCVEGLKGNITLFLSGRRDKSGITISTEWAFIIFLIVVYVISIPVAVYLGRTQRRCRTVADEDSVVGSMGPPNAIYHPAVGTSGTSYQSPTVILNKDKDEFVQKASDISKAARAHFTSSMAHDQPDSPTEREDYQPCQPLTSLHEESESSKSNISLECSTTHVSGQEKNDECQSNSEGEVEQVPLVRDPDIPTTKEKVTLLTMNVQAVVM